MSRSSSARAAYLYAESAALDVVNARLDTLQRERDEADDALRRAQQRADDLLAQHTLLKKRQKDLQDSVLTARAAYTQEFLVACPEDILRCIFETVADLPDRRWLSFGDGSYSHRRASTPFALAAVCIKWRRAALRCPRLWTYIGLPPPESIGRHPARVDLLLTRSCQHGLDIVTGDEWSHCHDSKAIDTLSECIAKISLHSVRWRMVELWLPPSDGPATWQSFVDVLKGPLPSLTHFAFVSDKLKLPPLAVTQGEGYLPFVPILQHLEFAVFGLDVSETYHIGFPSLVFLRTWASCSVDNAARIIRLGRSTLSCLDICGTGSEPSFSMILPKLGSLHFDSGHMSSAWSNPGQQLPQLTQLTINCRFVSTACSTFLQGVSSTVMDLGLFGPVTSEAIDILRDLSKITRLCLSQPIPGADTESSSCTLRDNIFAHIAEADQPIWPKLVSITVRPDATVLPGTLEGVLRLINKRKAQVDHNSAGSATTQQPARIEEVVFDCEQTPGWLKAEVARLLS